jgi:excisionase family DNA binding protein
MINMDDNQTDPTPDVQAKLKVEPRFFTLEQTAQYLNVSVAQIYALVRSGELPAIKMGGRGVWRMDRYKLEDFVDRLHDETSRWARSNPLNGREAE